MSWFETVYQRCWRNRRQGHSALVDLVGFESKVDGVAEVVPEKVSSNVGW